MHHIPITGKKFIPIFLSIVVICCSYSCKRHKNLKKAHPDSGFSYDAFTEKAEALFPIADTQIELKILPLANELRYTYLRNDYYPIWLSHGYKADPAADKFLTELADVTWDGMDPERYNLSALKKLKERLGKPETSLAEAMAFDTALTRSYLAVAKDLLIGRIVPKKADSLWYHANDSTWNAPLQLADIQSKYVSLDEFRSAVATYKLLRDEYKRFSLLSSDSGLIKVIARLKDAKSMDSQTRDDIASIISKEVPWVTTTENDTISEWQQRIMAYQDHMGIKPTGKTDSATIHYLSSPPDSLLPLIAANLERMRWMQQSFGTTYIIVNVPLMQLFFRRDGADVMRMRVVVGKPVRQTPSLYAVMANVVLNPPWGVPPTILKQDVLPGIEKSGDKYLAKKGLKAFDKKGKRVDAGQITSKNYRRYNYKQDPGDDNSLGYVKFNLPNPWDIYLHDTPHRGDFVKRYRALSSGCIRLQQPQEMALYILAEVEKKRFTKERIDSIIDTHKTQWQILKNKIPVHIAYLTAFEDSTNTHINFVSDVYHRDGKLIAALAK